MDLDSESEAMMAVDTHGDAYATHGVVGRGDLAASKPLDGFGVGVAEVFDAK